MNKKFVFYSVILVFLLIFWAGKSYFDNNASQIYASKGNHYYRMNDIKRAEEYYSKALEAGNKDSSVRLRYTDILMQLPQTTDTLQKLANIAQDDIKDGASVKAEYFLYDLKRDVHDKYPLNYIQQAPYNQKIIHWGKLPITYAFKNVSTVPKYFGYEIIKAFDEWEKSGIVKFLYTNKADADIIIEFLDNEKEELEEGQKYVIAKTLPITNQNTLFQMKIMFNTKNFENKYYTPNQIYNTALHEIFHALGYMGHSNNSNNIMYMSKNKRIEAEDSRAILNEADISTLKLLYKTKPDITNAEELDYEYIPYIVLGGKDEVNYNKEREAKNYITKAPTVSNGYVDYADSLVSQEKYPEAIKVLDRALLTATNDSEKFIIYYNLAVCYYLAGNYEIALNYLKDAKNLDDSEDLHYLSAEIYHKQNLPQKAIEEYVYLTGKNPNRVEYVVNLANLYILEHSYLKARKVLKNYINNHPEDKNNKLFKPYGILLF